MNILDNIRKSLTERFLNIVPEPVLRAKAAQRKGDGYSQKIALQARNVQAQTFKKWKLAVQAATDPDAPDYLPLYELYQGLETDNHLMGITDTRVQKVIRSRFNIINTNTGEANPELTTLFKRSWFEDLVRIIVTAKFKGSTLIELFDTTDTGEIAQVTEIPKPYINMVKGLVTKDPSDNTGWSYTEGTISNHYLQIGKWDDLGIWSMIAVIALSKKLAIGSWLDYIEKYGIPPRFVITDNMDATRQKELGDMMADMISAHYAVLQGNERIESLNTTYADAHNVFNELVKLANSEMSKRIFGGTGTTDENSYVGSTQAHQDNAELRHISDRFSVEYIINAELLPRLMKIGTAYTQLAGHHFAFDNSSELSPKDLITAVKDLSAFYEIDWEKVREKTGIPITGLKKAVEAAPVQKKKNSSSLTATLNNIYPAPSRITTISASSFDKTILNVFEKVIKLLFDNKLDAAIPADMMLITSERMAETLSEFETRTGAIGIKDKAFHAHLRQNLFKFGAAKTLAQFEALRDELTDENGEVRTWQDFKTEAMKLHKNYNVNWLKTEYITAKATARSASRWRSYEDEKELYDLRYDTANDDKVSEEHEANHGITRPVDDPVWDYLAPPLRERCRCGLRQVGKGSVLTTDEQLPKAEDVPERFRFNAGKERLIFNDAHPYIKNTTDKTLRELEGVKDYGLMTSERIYERKKILQPKMSIITKKEDAQQFINKLADNKGNYTLEALFSKEQSYPVSISKTNALKGNNWKYLNHTLDTLNDPSEVYEQNGKYTFIKFYEDQPIEVQVTLKDEQMTFEDINVLTQTQTDKARQGILHHVRKRR